MSVEVNAARGEVAVRIGGVEVAMAATMDGLAQVSAATGHPALQDLCRRLVTTEVATARAALRAFVLRGADAEGRPLKREPAVAAALGAFRLSDAGALAEAFAGVLAPLFRGEDEEPDPGNGSSAPGPTTS